MESAKRIATTTRKGDKKGSRSPGLPGPTHSTIAAAIAAVTKSRTKGKKAVNSTNSAEGTKAVAMTRVVAG